VMSPRDRVRKALEFHSVDVPPLQIHSSTAGLFEHGQKLADLMRSCGHDFGPMDDVRLPVVPPEHFDEDGRYHKIETDAWGTTWEYRIFGIWGHRKECPLADISRLNGYSAPPVPRLEGDDFGTQLAPIFPPEVWRRFFKPRYKAMLEPVVRAGRKVFFHSCGVILPMLEDFREFGADAIWPQLPLFDLGELARKCRELGLSVQLHPDRGELMQRRTPAEVRDRVLHLVDEFDCISGGSWLYIEIDPGFLWPNVEALFETAMELRGAASNERVGSGD
jgi:hypothetical protein